jgi:hypothetical protein
MKECVLACAFSLLVVPLRSAPPFYLALDTNTNQCRIMVTKPDGQLMRQLGNGPYGS